MITLSSGYLNGQTLHSFYFFSAILIPAFAGMTKTQDGG
jgi:hypothetical protein